MSREQWGHGYWRGFEDAKRSMNRTGDSFKDDVKFWIANMCISNWDKSESRTLYPVREWISAARMCGITEKYARKVYDYILRNNFYDFEPESYSWCYVSGGEQSNWNDDYFVIPIGDRKKEEWQNIADRILAKIQEGKNG